MELGSGYRIASKVRILIKGGDMRCPPDGSPFGTSLVGAAMATWLNTTPRPAFARDAEPALDGQADPAKGKLAFAAGDCASCHAAPGQSDRLRLGGGLALASPYDAFRVPNISMDRSTGSARGGPLTLPMHCQAACPRADRTITLHFLMQATPR